MAFVKRTRKQLLLEVYICKISRTCAVLVVVFTCMHRLSAESVPSTTVLESGNRARVSCALNVCLAFACRDFHDDNNKYEWLLS